MDEFDVFGREGWTFWGCVNCDGDFRVWHGLSYDAKCLSRTTGTETVGSKEGKEVVDARGWM